MLQTLTAPPATLAALRDERAALEVEREPLLAAVIRAELLAEQAAAQLAQTRALWDRLVGEAKEASRQADLARRALRRHDAAIAEVQAEIATPRGAGGGG